LFQSPPKFKPSLVGSTKGGTKIYANKLDDIMEEGISHMEEGNHILGESTFNPQFQEEHEESMIEPAYRKKKDSIDLDEENAMFATPTMEQNMQGGQVGFFGTDIKFKNSNY